MSRSFDTFLRLEDPSGITIATDDDGGGNRNSRIIFSAPSTGEYSVIATTYNGRLGPYTLVIRRGTGGSRGLRPGGFSLPIGPGGLGQMPMGQEPKEKDKSADGQFDVNDLAILESKKSQRSARVAALENIASSVSSAGNELAPRHARRLARYLLTVQDKELEEIAPKLESFTKCRHLILALADQVEKTEGPQLTAESVVGAVTGQTLQFNRDEDWRSACRRLLVQLALDLGAQRATSVGEQAAEMLRDLYKEQGYAFGMEEGELASLTRPAQALAAVIKHVAVSASKDGAAPEHRDYLERVGRHVQAAQFVADNDLERLIILQRVWLRVLSIYLHKSHPEIAASAAEIQQQLVTRDRRASNVLDQLRAGEETTLRIWSLAHNPK